MYYINQLEELTETRLLKIINDFTLNKLPILQRYKDYYDGNQDILYKQYRNPDITHNAVISNYCYNIVSNYEGYLCGLPITYNSEEDISDLTNILDYNDVHNEDSNLLESALIYGVSYEVNYIDYEANVRFKMFDSKEIIPIYSNDLESELLACIRIYSANDIENDQKTYVDVYTDKEIRHYESLLGFASLNFIESKRHYYNMVPITVFSLNEEEKSIFDRIILLQNAYNNLLSCSIDDYEAFVDSYLVLIGATVDDDELEKIRQRRVIEADEVGQVFYLTKDEKGEQKTQWLLNEIKEEIHKIAQSPDFSDESFMSQSGIAIRYRLLGMENQASSIESAMKKALLRRIELINQMQRLTLSGEGWSQIDIVFTRNLPSDLQEIITNINSLRSLVSDKTLLSQLPFIKDVDKELELLEEQRESEKDSVNYEFNYEEDEE